MRSSPLIVTSGAARRSADLRLAWLGAAVDVHEAYLAWRDADRSDRSEAFLVYHAALDREATAARALQVELCGCAPRPLMRLCSRARATASARSATPSLR